MCSSKGSSQVRIFLFFLLILILKSIIRLKYIHFKTSTIIILNCNKVKGTLFIILKIKNMYIKFSVKH